MEPLYSGVTERVLGVTPTNAVETALMQARTIDEYIDLLRQMGTYPDLENPETRLEVSGEMRNALRHHVWHDWIVIYQDGREFEETFSNPLRILDLLQREDGIKSVVATVMYEIMVDQERDD